MWKRGEPDWSKIRCAACSAASFLRLPGRTNGFRLCSIYHSGASIIDRLIVRTYILWEHSLNNALEEAAANVGWSAFHRLPIFVSRPANDHSTHPTKEQTKFECKKQILVERAAAAVTATDGTKARGTEVRVRVFVTARRSRQTPLSRRKKERHGRRRLRGVKGGGGDGEFEHK